MTSPACLNCHSMPDTPPNFADPILFPKTDGKETADPKCRAQAYWPDWLSTAYPEWQKKMPWWVQSNFEAARLQKIAEHPIRLDIAEADLDLKITTDAFEVSQEGFQDLGAGPFLSADIRPGPGGSITSHIEILNNEIPLQLRSLLEFNDIQIDGPLFANVNPQRISVGDVGGLRFTAGMNSCLLSIVAMLLDSFGADATKQNDPPTLDVGLTKYLLSFLKTNGSLPSAFNLETLIDTIRKRPPSPTPAYREPSAFKLEALLNYLQPGSGLTLSIPQLKDFFFPGIIDLGPSSGTVKLNVTSDKKLAVDISDLLLKLDPMDYPAKTNKSPSGLHLESGEIHPGKISHDATGKVFEPGIHALYNPHNQQLDTEANLEINLQIGNMQISGNILLKTSFKITPHGLKIVPRTTTLEIKNLNAVSRDKKSHSLTNVDLYLNDESPQTDSNNAALLLGNLTKADPAFAHVFDKPIATLRISGTESEKKDFKLSAQLPLSVDGEGNYDFSRILQDLSLQALLQFGNKGEDTSYLTHLNAQSNPSTFGSEDLGFLVSFDAEKVFGKDPNHQSIIQNGSLSIQHHSQGEKKSQISVELKTGPVDLGKVYFSNIGIHGEVEQASYANGVLEFRIPAFLIQANSGGSASGLVRGPLSIEQNGATGESLIIVWDNHQKQVKIAGLDLMLSAQELYVIPKAIKPRLNSSVASIGVDGHLTGHFTMNFPEDRKKWNGSGDIRLRGDRGGDIYLLDPQGNRVGPPLLRDTQWDFYKINWINWDRGYALGRFQLNLTANLGSLLARQTKTFTEVSPLDLIAAYGIDGQRLGAFEINGQMAYDNQPVTAQGFMARSIDYIIDTCRKTPGCPSGELQKELKP